MEGRRSTDAAKGNRKKILTQAERNQIRTFHHSHPLVTHTQIAGFFGLERSTVTKIIGQPPSQSSSAQSSVTATPAMAYTQNTPFSQSPPMAANTLATEMNPPNGCMSVEAFQTQSYVTRALTLWAQQKQQQGIRVTQKMIRQEAATLAALHERSMRTSDDASSSAESMSMGRSTPPQTFSRSSSEGTSATTTSSNYSTSGASSNAGWNPDWLLGGDPRPDHVGLYGASSMSATTYAAPAWPQATNFQAPLPSSLDFGSSYLSPPHKEAFRQTTERLRSGSDPHQAIEDLASYLKADNTGLSSFDFLCLEHLRERVAGNNRVTETQAFLDWNPSAEDPAHMQLPSMSVSGTGL